MMLARLRRMAWQDWAAPVQILLGLSLLAIALAQAPHEEALGRTGPNAACMVTGPCPT